MSGGAVTVLYVSDLDGTLLNDRQGLSATTVEIINGLVAEGLLFTVATARSPGPVVKLLHDLDLRLPIIGMNGAAVADPATGALLHRATLSAPVTAGLVDERLAAGLNPFVFTMDEAGEHHVYHRTIGNDCERTWVDNRLALGDRRFRQVDDLAPAYAEEIFAVTVLAPRADLVPLHDRAAADPQLYAHLSPDIYVDGFWWLETHHADANKGAAVTWVAEHVAADRIVCFGDNGNDLPMFAVADEAYAMAGASPEVLAAATAMIGSHTDDAVARFLRDVTGVTLIGE